MDEWINQQSRPYTITSTIYLWDNHKSYVNVNKFYNVTKSEQQNRVKRKLKSHGRNISCKIEFLSKPKIIIDNLNYLK